MKQEVAAVDAVKQLSEDVGIPKDLKDIVKPEDVDFLAQALMTTLAVRATRVKQALMKSKSFIFHLCK